MITYTCDFCQVIFNAKKPSKNTKQHCSKHCYSLSRLSNRCKICSKLILGRLIYCGEECRTTATNARKLEKENLPKKQYPLSDFAKNTRRKRATQRTRELKLQAIRYKGGKCQCCGYNKCPAALEFHHVDPTKKEKSIANMRRSWKYIKVELDKCVLVCSNCHREIHTGFTNMPEQIIEKPVLSKVTSTSIE